MLNQDIARNHNKHYIYLHDLNIKKNHNFNQIRGHDLSCYITNLEFSRKLVRKDMDVNNERLSNITPRQTLK